MLRDAAPVVRHVASALDLPTGVAGILLGAAGALVVATLIRGLLLVLRTAPETRERWRSLATWWLLLVALTVALWLGRTGVVVAMALVSLLLMRETLSLTDAGAWWPAGVLVALAAYLWAWLDWASFFLGAVPLVLLAGALVEVLVRAGAGPAMRWRRIRRFVVALLVAVVGPSHVVAVASAPPAGGSSTPVAWLVVLLLLTELNDIAQAWAGRAVGRHAMAPVLSPRKTWEGLAGGLAFTTLAAVLVVPVAVGGLDGATFGGVPGLPGQLPGPSWLGSAGLGLAVSLAGTAGDLTGSALKRAAGVKDSGDLLPGHGGVLDRFDSLVLSAPAFFAMVHLPGGGP